MAIINSTLYMAKWSHYEFFEQARCGKMKNKPPNLYFWQICASLVGNESKEPLRKSMQK